MQFMLDLLFMGAIESANWIASSDTIYTSEQQLVDFSNLKLGSTVETMLRFQIICFPRFND